MKKHCVQEFNHLQKRAMFHSYVRLPDGFSCFITPFLSMSAVASRFFEWTLGRMQTPLHLQRGSISSKLVVMSWFPTCRPCRHLQPPFCRSMINEFSLWVVLTWQTGLCSVQRGQVGALLRRAHLGRRRLWLRSPRWLLVVLLVVILGIQWRCVYRWFAYLSLSLYIYIFTLLCICIYICMYMYMYVYIYMYICIYVCTTFAYIYI